jgi:hypothetical protein
MTLITDPDSLNDGATDNGSTEVFIKTSDKTMLPRPRFLGGFGSW